MAKLVLGGKRWCSKCGWVKPLHPLHSDCPKCGQVTVNRPA